MPVCALCPVVASRFYVQRLHVPLYFARCDDCRVPDASLKPKHKIVELTYNEWVVSQVHGS